MLAPRLLLLISAVLHAAWNALLKKHPQPHRMTGPVLTIAAVVTALTLPFFPLLPPSPTSLIWALAAGGFEGLYFYALARALTQAPLGPAYALIRGGAMALVWVLSVVLLAEPLGAGEVLGALLILLALILINRPAPRGAASTSQQPRYGAAYAAAVFVAGYHLCYGRALAADGQPNHVFGIAMMAAVPINIAANAWAHGRKGSSWGLRLSQPKELALLAVTGVICAVSFLLFLGGLAHTGAGEAITIRNTSIIFAQLMAFAQGERLTPVQWLGVLSAFAGASLVTAP